MIVLTYEIIRLLYHKYVKTKAKDHHLISIHYILDSSLKFLFHIMKSKFVLLSALKKLLLCSKFECFTKPLTFY